MTTPIRIFLQTTIASTENGWHVVRVSLLRDHLARLTDGSGRSLCEVTARDRVANADGDDDVLSRLDSTGSDEPWLFAVDVGDGLTEPDCRGITRFRQRGGGLLTTRDQIERLRPPDREPRTLRKASRDPAPGAARAARRDQVRREDGTGGPDGGSRSEGI